MFTELLACIFAETSDSEPQDVGTTDDVIEINPEAMYKLPDADEPIDGNTLKNRQMMQSDYTKKTQRLSEQEKTWQEQLAQKEEQIEKLNNQLKSLQLDDKFQQTQVSGSQSVTDTGGNDNEDWLWNTTNTAPEQQQTQDGINSTPENNMNLEQLAELLAQHPKFQQPYQEKIKADIQTLFSQERKKSLQDQEDLERNLQIENEYKQKYGQKGVDLLYAREHAKQEGDVSRFFELESERDKLVAAKAIEAHKAEQEKAQKEMVEEAMSGPVRIEPQEDESEQSRKRRVKRETIKRAKAAFGPWGTN